MTAPDKASKTRTWISRVRRMASQSMPRFSGLWLLRDGTDASHKRVRTSIRPIAKFRCELPHMSGKRDAPARSKFVMPGHSSLSCADCVNLSAMPGIHVLKSCSGKDVDGRDEPGNDSERRLTNRCRGDAVHR